MQFAAFTFLRHAQPRGLLATWFALWAALYFIFPAAAGKALAASVSISSTAAATSTPCDARESQAISFASAAQPEPAACTHSSTYASRCCARSQLPLSGGLAKTMTAGGVRGNATGSNFSTFSTKTKTTGGGLKLERRAAMAVSAARRSPEACA